MKKIISVKIVLSWISWRYVKKFIDIYSVGFKVTDGDGKSLRNDVDVMRMMKEHEYVRCIYVYLDKDQTTKPLSFKMPHDNLTIGKFSHGYSLLIILVGLCRVFNYFCIFIVSNVQSNPKVIDLKILGDLKVKKKIKVCGTVTRGIEEVCTVQFFICMSQEFDVENDLQAISQSMTKKASNYKLFFISILFNILFTLLFIFI